MTLTGVSAWTAPSTVTLDAAPGLPLRDLTDDELAAMYAGADEDTSRAVLAEARRRDREARRTTAERNLQYEWYDAMHAQRMAAEAFCGGGGMLNHEGLRRQVSEWDLWTGSWSQVQRYGSEDLLWFFEHKSPRLTFGEFKRRRQEAGRIQREQWRDRDQISNGGSNDEHDGDTGPGLAQPQSGPLRRDETPPEAPPAGPGRTMDRGGSSPLGADDGNRAEAAGSGGPGGTVPPVAREDGDDESPRKAPTFDEIADQDDSTDAAGTRAKTFDQVEEMEQEWLWDGMIPAGLLTVLFGPPKASKTTLVIDYAARISRGDVNPDGTSLGPAAPVLLGALEDISESSTIKKLKAAGADLSKVVDISGGPDGDGLELELDHVAWLHEVAAEYPGVALIVIDTLSNSANKSITTRPGLKAMLKPLAKLAENTGAAVVLTCHSLKGHDDIPEGGRSLVSIPRMVLQIGKSQDEPGVRTLSVYASNVASDSSEGYRYKLIEDGPASRIEWCWDSVRTGPGPEATGQNRILLLLRNSEEPLSAQLIAAKTGINYAVTRVLLTRMKHRGDVAQGEERGTWTIPAEMPALQAV